MSIISRENVIVVKEPTKVFKGIDQKKVILLTTAGAIGIKVAELVTKYSPIVDSLIFKTIPNYLMGYDFCFMGYLPVPNWFSFFCIVALVVYTWADIKIRKKERLEKLIRR